MKELSIEQKAKRYDEALTKAKNIVNSINVGLIGKDSFEAVFPELKESDDERIIRRIINIVDEYSAKHQIDNTDCIDWLEKQGEQKPAEWSEEDNIMVENIRNSFGLHCGQMTEALKEQYDKFFNKVKFLKERYTWKPSSEQMRVLEWCKPLFAEPESKGILESLIDDLKKLKG